MAATLALVLLIPGTGYAEAAESTSSGWQHYTLVVFDAIVVRPLGMLGLALGVAFVVPVALLTWPSGRGTIDQAIEQFVTPQAKSVFERPLGDL